MIRGLQVIHYLVRRHLQLWLFVEYFVVKTIEDLYESVFIILFSRDAPKLEDAAANFVPKSALRDVAITSSNPWVSDL